MSEEEIIKSLEYANEQLKEEIAEMLHNDFPEFLKEFLNAFVKTRFYKKQYEESVKTYKDYNVKFDDYFRVDWECPILSSNKNYTNEELVNGLLEVGVFGTIPHYQYDELKVIVINFKDKEAHLETGYAVQPYASYVLKSKRNIPKYMQPLIDKLFRDYDEYIERRSEI